MKRGTRTPRRLGGWRAGGPRRWALAALASILPAGVAAQEHTGAAPRERADTLVLSLEEAIAIAEGANPTFRQTENQLALNGSEARATWMGDILPDASLTLLNTGYGGRLQRFGTDDFGNPTPNENAQWFYDSRTSQAFSLNWTLQGPSVLTARRQLRQSQQGRQLAVASARTSLHTDVSRQYYEALEQEALVALEASLTDARSTDLESARRLFELARATQVDVLNAEVQVDQQRISLQQQRRAHEQAVLTLRTTLGDPELPPLGLAGLELPIFDPSGLDDDALVARAVRENPTVVESESGVQGASLALDEAGAWKWPTLDVTYTTARFIARSETEALFDVGYDPNELQHSFSVGLTVPFLNNFFQNRYAEAQASVQLENERESLRQTRLEVGQNVRAQLIELRNQHESLRLAERSEQIAARATELAREEWRLGGRTFQELQQTILQEADARRQTIQARFSFMDALVTLESLVGGPVAPAGAPGAP